MATQEERDRRGTDEIEAEAGWYVLAAQAQKQREEVVQEQRRAVSKTA